MEPNNTNTTIDTQNVNEAKSELETLGSGLQAQTAIEEHRKGQLMQHMKDLKENNQGWLNPQDCDCKSMRITALLPL